MAGLSQLAAWGEPLPPPLPTTWQLLSCQRYSPPVTRYTQTRQQSLTENVPMFTSEISMFNGGQYLANIPFNTRDLARFSILIRSVLTCSDLFLCTWENGTELL